MKKKLKSLMMTFTLALTVAGASVGLDIPVLNEGTSVYAATEGKPSNHIPSLSIGSDGEMANNVGGLKAESGQEKSIYNTILKQVRTVIIFISGIGTLLMVAFFVLNFITLGKSQGNPQERQKAVSGLIMTGLATAGLGSVFLVTTLFYNMLGNEEGEGFEEASTYIEQTEIRA
jgi:hypothetical protein